MSYTDDMPFTERHSCSLSIASDSTIFDAFSYYSDNLSAFKFVTVEEQTIQNRRAVDWKLMFILDK